MSKSYVGSIGPKSAPIAFFGEAPAKYEVMQGEPFVGPAGEMFNKVIQRAGIIRSMCYIDNVIQQRLPNDKIDSMYHDKGKKKPKGELLDWFVDAWKRVGKLEANVIVTLGETPLRCFVDTGWEHGGSGVTSWRGSVLPGVPEINGRKVFITVHPQYVNYMPTMYPILQLDMNRLAKEYQSPTIDLPHRDLLHAKSEHDVEALVDRCLSSDLLAIDIETRRGQIACIGFATSWDWAMTIPLTTKMGRYWKDLDLEVWVWQQIHKILSSSVPKVFQHSMYDCPWLSRNGFKIANVMYDTMLMMSIAYPEMSKSLEFMTSIFTPWPYYKDDVKDWTTVDDAILWEYNAKDCAVDHEICVKLIKNLEGKGLLDFYHNHTHKLLSPVFKSISRGFKFDTHRREELKEEIETKASLLSAQLVMEAGKRINVRSAPQMAKWLYDEMKLQPVRDKGARKTDEDALIKLARKYDKPGLHTALALRKHLNFLSKDVDISIDPDDRFRCTVNVAGTVTGRFSTSKNPWGTGKNIQTIPEVDDPTLYRFNGRVMYIADEGYTLIVPDLAQAEDRWVAYLSEDEAVIQAYEEGIDQHIKLANIFLDRDIMELKQTNPILFRRYRDLFKVANHAANYGIGWSKFRDEVLQKIRIWLEAPEAKRLLAVRHQLRPRLRYWHQEIRDTVRRTRVLETPFGRKRMFYGRLGEDTFRKAFGHIPQSGVSDTVKVAAVQIDEKYPWMQYLGDQHDGLIYQVPDDRLEEAIPLVNEEMSIPITIKGRTFVVPVEFKCGKVWGELTEWPQKGGS